MQPSVEQVGKFQSVYLLVWQLSVDSHQPHKSLLLLVVLSLQLDAWVEEHEAAEAARKAAQQAAMAEDGWTVVTRTKVRTRQVLGSVRYAVDAAPAPALVAVEVHVVLVQLPGVFSSS